MVEWWAALVFALALLLPPALPRHPLSRPLSALYFCLFMRAFIHRLLVRVFPTGAEPVGTFIQPKDPYGAGYRSPVDKEEKRKYAQEQWEKEKKAFGGVGRGAAGPPPPPLAVDDKHADALLQKELVRFRVEAELHLENRLEELPKKKVYMGQKNREGLPDGFGVETIVGSDNPTPSTYYGMFRAGKREGYGVWASPRGQVHKGAWR